MAGSIPISLTQQLSRSGSLLVGGRLYFFTSGTTTPANAFSDTGLTNALPNPITLDDAGRIPQLFFPDGTIRYRLTDAAGAIQVDADNVLVIGPTGGGGGGGGGATVDPTAVAQTGDSIFSMTSGFRPGWVHDNGRTIGSSLSGALERSNADCQNLFTFLWQNFSDAQCPVLTGRGASAAADWAANKQITLPDMRGMFIAGVDNMGNSTLGWFNNVPFASGNATTPGSILGENVHTLTLAEVPRGINTFGFSDPGHSHTYNRFTGTGTSGSAGGSAWNGFFDAPETSNNVTGITATLTDNAGNGVHNNTPRSMLVTFYRKL